MPNNFGDRICSFSSNGKTFFFNHATSRNQRPYLQINAMFGEGREKITIFSDQALDFLSALKKGLEKTFEINVSTALRCPACGSGPAEWKIFVVEPTGTEWTLMCNAEGCATDTVRQVIAQNVGGKTGV